MIEKNYDILKKTIDRLPEREADNSSWDSVSNSLDNLDSEKFISKTKSTLPKYKAPKKAWKGIEEALSKPWYHFDSNGIINIGIITAVSTIIALSVLLLYPEKENNDENISEISLEKSISENNTIEITKSPDLEKQDSKALNEISENSESKEQKEKEKEEENYLSEIKNRDSENEEPAKIKTEQESGNLANVSKSEDITENKTTTERKNRTIKEAIIKKDANSHLTGIKSEEKIIVSERDNATQPIATIADNQNDRNNTKEIEKVKHRNPSQNKFNLNLKPLFNKKPKEISTFREKEEYKEKVENYYFGGFYSFINYQNLKLDESELPETASTFGLEFMLEKRKFFFKTAISYLAWQESANCIINYKQNEIVYSYQYVDSIYTNPISGEITYYTSTIDIFDSIDYQQNDKINYSYKVFQIPLILGYKIFEQKKFTISLNGGIGLDILIERKENRPFFAKESASLTNIKSLAESRFEINYRVLGGFSAYYQISNKISINIEPSFQLYLKPLYKNEALKNATYFEVKAGIFYKF